MNPFRYVSWFFNLNWYLRLFLIHLLILFIAYIDSITHPELSIRLLYLIPLFLSVWDGKGIAAGLYFSFVCTFVYFYSEFLQGNIHFHGFYLIWEFIIVLSYFIVYIVIVGKIKKTTLILSMKNDELNASNVKLEKVNNQKDKFFSIIAHDLKGPFQGLIGLTKHMAAENNNLSASEITTFSEELNKCVLNLYKLLENLLEWAKLQQNIIEYNPAKLILSEIFSRNMEIINQRASQKGITILNNIPENIVIYSDEMVINTILRNLLFNAVKYTRTGGKVIGKAKNIEGEMVEISITDTGIGMTAEFVRKLFSLGEKVRTVGTDNEPGTGLGLILCKEFVEKYGGKIWVESRKDFGSTFYFTVHQRQT